jgi:hypothetical protein
LGLCGRDMLAVSLSALHPKATYTDYVTMRWPKFRVEKWIPAPDASTLTLRGDN